jgi:hypothetical protein
LNPQEQVWNVLKRRERTNVRYRDFVHPGQALVRAILQRCFAHAPGELSLSPTRSIDGFTPQSMQLLHLDGKKQFLTRFLILA